MDKNENFKDEVLRLAKENKVVFMGIDGRPQVSDLDNMIDTQPTEGLLYDLNRLPETVLTRIDDPKWVNDFAVQLVITRLKENLVQSTARIEQLENHIGEMGSMMKFNEMKARISQLEQRACEVEAFTSAGYHMDNFNDLRKRIRELERAIKNEVIDICDACAGREEKFLIYIEEVQFDERIFEWAHLPKDDALDFYRCKAPRLARVLSEKSDKEK